MKPELLPEEIAVIVRALRYMMDQPAELGTNVSDSERFAAANAIEYFENEGTENNGHPTLLEVEPGQTPRLVTVPNDATLLMGGPRGYGNCGRCGSYLCPGC